MIKAHEIKLYPTRSQRTLLHKSFGIARHSFNWALAKWKELYEAGEKPSAYSLSKKQEVNELSNQIAQNCALS